MTQFLLAVVFWAPNAFGFGERDMAVDRLSHLDSPSQYAYSFVMRYCESWDLAFSQMTSGSLYELGHTAINASALGVSTRLRNEGKSRQLTHLIESYGYYLGLNDCFGDNQSAKDLFTVNVIAGDLLGTAGGAAIGGLTWVAGGRLLTWLGKKLLPKSWAPRIQKGFYVLVGATTGGYVVVNIYQTINARMEYLELKEAERAETIEILESVKKDRAELQSFMDGGELDPADLATAEVFIDKLNARIAKIEQDLLL